jgi:general secretion pathway protein N
MKPQHLTRRLGLNWREWRSARSATRVPGSGFAESSLAQAAWERKRKAVARWGWAGLLCGGLVALVAFAPAAWLAAAVTSATNQRVLLADARGTVWRGSAVPVLTGGPDSRSATLLPGRTSWAIGLRGMTLELRVRQPCCINNELVLLLRPGLGRLGVQLPAGSSSIGEWPAAWLAGLGAPWNTLQLGGTLRLASPGLSLDAVGGRFSFTGQASLDLSDISSRLSTLDRLGSYRVDLAAGGAAGQGPTIALSTLDGALLLSGQGQWSAAQLRFRGEARAAPGSEGVLDNLLNIFGRRQGALSIISIG